MRNRIISFLCFLLLFPTGAFSQSDGHLQAGYYVVVGAFGVQDNAVEFAETLRTEGHDAQYGMDPFRKLHYVYLLYSADFKSALTAMQEYRRSGTFDEAWVKTVTGDMPAPPVAKALPEEKASEESPVKVEEAEKKAEIKSLQAVVARKVEEEDKRQDLEVVEKKIKAVRPTTLATIQVFLNLFNPTNNRIIDGKVQVIDTERARLMTIVNGNDMLFLPNPETHTGELSLITDVFGYRKIQHEINYFKPLADTIDNAIEYADGTIIINFDLVRYRKGDVTVLYNVYFYDDAALMRPESRYELNSLLQMMEENPDYEILLHGHTNAKYYGKILSPGPEKVFFEITGDAKESNGSARSLARKRAETIRDYLVVNGIDEDRIKIKAWGGKKPIVNPLGPDAHQNVRVEVEILEE